MFRIPCRLVMAAALRFATAAAIEAAPARNVTIVVLDAAGAPVANARVLVAADEMDAVGTTDSAGSVRVSTTSSSIRVEATRGSQKAATTSSANTVTVRLPGGGQ
jgi:uncharacterized protein GlcG (DUF336 family)